MVSSLEGFHSTSDLVTTQNMGFSFSVSDIGHHEKQRVNLCTETQTAIKTNVLIPGPLYLELKQMNSINIERL